MFLYPETGVFISNIFLLNTITIHTGIFLLGLRIHCCLQQQKLHMLVNKASLKLLFFYRYQTLELFVFELMPVIVFVSALSGTWKVQLNPGNKTTKKVLYSVNTYL